MNNPRRIFLSQISLMAGAATLCKPMASAAAITKHINTLHSAKNAVTVYHTNDIRGNIDTVYKNKGGLNRVKAELDKQEIRGLLLDAGNFINGSNGVYQHKQLISTMNNMGYHAAGIGNEELAQGQDYLATLAPAMKFPLLNCNYEFTGNLKSRVKPYTIITTGRFRIGITAVGSQLDGIKYNDAIASANKFAGILKNNEKCDLVICLSHLDYMVEGDAPDNQKLAARSENIDLIIGSNNDKLMASPMILANKLKHEVVLSQTAWDGLMMGHTVINFDSDKQKCGLIPQHIIPGVPPKLFAASFTSLGLAKPKRV